MNDNSLFRFASRDSSGQELHWGRVFDDGVPFRGSTAKMYRSDDEWQENTYKFGQVQIGRFDITDPEQMKRYCDILTSAVNGFFRILVHNPQYDPEKKMNYLEWIEYFMQDKHTVARAPVGAELPPTNGHSNNGSNGFHG